MFTMEGQYCQCEGKRSYSSDSDSAAIIPAEEQRALRQRFPRRCPRDPKCRGREGMEESFETFEEELGPPRADPPPQKPVRQIRRPEMYATRKVREEMPPVSQQPRAEPRTSPRETSFPRTTSLQKALSIQNLSQIETPWENVTLNRCLFVAITILVLTSGFQRLHETLRGQGAAEDEEEEVGLTMRRSGSLRQRGHPPEPETTLWEVMFWWLPDLDDEDDDEEEDDDGEVKRGRSKRGATGRASRGLRNKPLPDKKLMKQREGKLKDRRAKKDKDEEVKKQRDKTEEPEKEAEEEVCDEEEEDEGNEEAVPKKSKKLEEKKAKKKTQKG